MSRQAEAPPAVQCCPSRAAVAARAAREEVGQLRAVRRDFLYGASDADILIGTAADVLCMGQDTAVDALVKTPGP